MLVPSKNSKQKIGLFRLPVKTWLTWLGLSALYLGVILLAFPAPERANWWLALGPMALAMLVFCHDRTLGRSSPLAAAAFLLGPLGALAALVYWNSSQRSESTPGYIAIRGAANDFEILSISFYALMAGLVFSSIAALAFAWYTRAEWLPYHTRWDAPEENNSRAIPKCLAVFGLNHNSSLEDLQIAYRARVKREHPDHGGTAEGFKRLQRYHDLATKVLQRFGRN